MNKTNIKSLLFLALTSFMLTGISCFKKKDNGTKSAKEVEFSEMSSHEESIEITADSNSDSLKEKAHYKDRVFFGFDVSNKTEDLNNVIEKTAQDLVNNESLCITIEGNCDKRGSKSYNEGLGERRANSVKKEIVAKAIEIAKKSGSTVSASKIKARIQVVSKGVRIYESNNSEINNFYNSDMDEAFALHRAGIIVKNTAQTFKEKVSQEVDSIKDEAEEIVFNITGK